MVINMAIHHCFCILQLAKLSYEKEVYYIGMLVLFLSIYNYVTQFTH